MLHLQPCIHLKKIKFFLPVVRITAHQKLDRPRIHISRRQRQPNRSLTHPPPQRRTPSAHRPPNPHAPPPSTGSRYAEAARSASPDTPRPTRSSSPPHCSPP